MNDGLAAACSRADGLHVSSCRWRNVQSALLATVLLVTSLLRSAPEMLWGAKCTEKADIYSFGACCKAAMSGHMPKCMPDYVLQGTGKAAL